MKKNACVHIREEKEHLKSCSTYESNHRRSIGYQSDPPPSRSASSETGLLEHRSNSCGVLFVGQTLVEFNVCAGRSPAVSLRWSVCSAAFTSRSTALPDGGQSLRRQLKCFAKSAKYLAVT